MTSGEKRRRNVRPSKYRPRTAAQLARKRELWAARRDDREAARRGDEEGALRARLEMLEAALREAGQDGVHKQRHIVPLEEIEDDARRFHVLKARVERLDALWSINRRRRETRAKIVIGGALLAEAGEAGSAADEAFRARLLDILDRRVERVRDRLAVRELLGGSPLPLRRGGGLDEDVATALEAGGDTLPSLDQIAESALADGIWDPLAGDERDPEDAERDPVWRAA